MESGEGFQRTRYRQIGSRYRVSSIAPGRSYTTTLVDQPGNHTTTSVEPTEAGTRLMIRSDLLIAFPEACSGGMLVLPLVTRVRRASDAATVPKGKQALRASAPPGQPTRARLGPPPTANPAPRPPRSPQHP